MRITIIKNDKLVVVDDKAVIDESLDFSDLPSNWHALQWEGANDGSYGQGEIEYNATENNPRINEPISSILEYMVHINKVKDFIAAQMAASVPEANTAIPE